MPTSQGSGGFTQEEVRSHCFQFKNRSVEKVGGTCKTGLKTIDIHANSKAFMENQMERSV